MTLTLHRAVECFEENLKLFTDPENEPEKHNLYAGLTNLAQGVADLDREVHELREELQELRRILTSRR